MIGLPMMWLALYFASQLAEPPLFSSPEDGDVIAWPADVHLEFSLAAGDANGSDVCIVRLINETEAGLNYMLQYGPASAWCGQDAVYSEELAPRRTANARTEYTTVVRIVDPQALARVAMELQKGPVGLNLCVCKPGEDLALGCISLTYLTAEGASVSLERSRLLSEERRLQDDVFGFDAACLDNRAASVHASGTDITTARSRLAEYFACFDVPFPWLISTHARSLGLGPNILQQTWSVLEAAHARGLESCESPRIWMMWVLVGRALGTAAPLDTALYAALSTCGPQIRVLLFIAHLRHVWPEDMMGPSWLDLAQRAGNGANVTAALLDVASLSSGEICIANRLDSGWRHAPRFHVLLPVESLLVVGSWSPVYLERNVETLLQQAVSVHCNAFSK
jgi:hypothetical protein